MEFLELIKTFGIDILKFSPVGILTWYFTKRHFQHIDLKKANTEAEGMTSDVIVKNLEIYQNMLDDVVRRKDAEISALEERVNTLEEKLKVLEQ